MSDKIVPTLSGHQRKAIAALLAEPTIKDAAKMAGLTRVTIHKYLNEPHFASALAQAESEQISALARTMAAASTTAIAALVGIIEDPQSTRSEVIRAAGVIVGNLASIRLLGSVETRLLDLEQSQNIPIGEHNGKR